MTTVFTFWAALDLWVLTLALFWTVIQDKDPNRPLVFGAGVIVLAATLPPTVWATIRLIGGN